MINSNFPIYEAKPLIELPSTIPQIGYFGTEQAKEIDDSIKRDYKGINALQIGEYFDNIVKGSNPFYVVAVQDRLPSGIRVATQGDLERAMREGRMNFKGTYENTGLVLRTDGDPNEYLARDLMLQVKARNKKQKMPVMIPLYGLTLVKDQNSLPYGLRFKLKEDAEIIDALILNQGTGNFSSDDINEKIGLPTKLGRGDRTLSTTNSGLSRLYLNWDLNLNSSNDNLAFSGGSGRVVLVSTAEGSSQAFLDERLKEPQI